MKEHVTPEVGDVLEISFSEYTVKAQIIYSDDREVRLLRKYKHDFEKNIHMML